ncbi:MAG: dienelactone hydrolase family protein [Planctomycetota bacterium]
MPSLPCRRFVLLASVLGCWVFASPASAQSEPITGPLPYEHEGVELEAYLARPAPGITPAPGRDDEQLPGVLIAHAWWGQGEYARHRARRLAELGYVAVVLDMYGKGVYTDDPNQASQLAGRFYNQRRLFRARAAAGLDVLKRQPGVDPDRCAAIGYCFGGTTVLELAYHGADLAGVVSFHGSLLPPRPDSLDADNVNAKVLIAHGQADPFYANDTLLKVIDDLQAADADVTTVLYSGAVHSFTDPSATGELAGARYDRDADRRSWEHMKVFFNEIFAE